MAYLIMWGGVLHGGNLRQSEKLLQRALNITNEAKGNAVNDNAKVVLYLLFAKTKCLLGDYSAVERLATDGYDLARQLEWSWGLANGQQILGDNQLWSHHIKGWSSEKLGKG